MIRGATHPEWRWLWRDGRTHTGTTRSTGPTIQIDHVVPWDPHGPPGQTGTHNLTPLSTYHHRLKTHGKWQSTMPWPGVHLWRDPHGQVYLHDTSGTRGLDKLDRRRGAA